MSRSSDDDLGLLRDAGEAEPGRDLALVHHAVAGEVRVGGVVHDQRAEVARVGQRAAHDARVGQRAPAVGEADRAGFLEEAELGHLAAGEALGQRRHRIDADRPPRRGRGAR